MGAGQKGISPLFSLVFQLGEGLFVNTCKRMVSGKQVRGFSAAGFTKVPTISSILLISIVSTISLS